MHKPIGARRVLLAVALMVIGIFAISVGVADSTPNSRQHTQGLSPGCVEPISIQSFRPTAAAVWDVRLWKRGQPGKAGLAVFPHALRCAASPDHRHAIKQTWIKDKKAYYRYRGIMVLHRRVEPNYGCTVGGCGWWAIKAWSVNCESGGGAVASNIYGNLTSTYHGGSKWEQSVSAWEVLQQPGVTYESAWLQWETGCEGWPG